MKFQGGESAVQRLMQAYGFTMKKQLGDHLGAGTGTISTWVKRDYFPGEAIVRCALETGVSLEWLATGTGMISKDIEGTTTQKMVRISAYYLLDGVLEPTTDWVGKPFEHMAESENLILVHNNNCSFFIDMKFSNTPEGTWLIERQKILSVVDMKLAPGEQWRIDGELWPMSQIKVIGKAVTVIKKL